MRPKLSNMEHYWHGTRFWYDICLETLNGVEHVIASKWTKMVHAIICHQISRFISKYHKISSNIIIYHEIIHTYHGISWYVMIYHDTPTTGPSQFTDYKQHFYLCRLHPSSSIIHHHPSSIHHPSSSIIIHHHPSSSIIIHHHPSSSSNNRQKCHFLETIQQWRCTHFCPLMSSMSMSSSSSGPNFFVHLEWFRIPHFVDLRRSLARDIIKYHQKFSNII